MYLKSTSVTVFCHRFALFILVLFSSALTLPTLAQETDETDQVVTKITEIKIGYFIMKPLAFTKNGEATGASVDYMEGLAETMGLSIQWIEFPFTRLIAMLDNEKLDAVLFLAKNKARAAKYLYPKKPFTHIRPGLAVLDSNALDTIQSTSDLADISIGHPYRGILSSFMLHKDINVTGVHSSKNSFKQLLQMLDNQRFQAVYSPLIDTLRFEAVGREYQHTFKYLTLPEPEVGVYTVFSKKASALLKRYEKAFNLQTDELIYQRILDSYFIAH